MWSDNQIMKLVGNPQVIGLLEGEQDQGDAGIPHCSHRDHGGQAGKRANWLIVVYVCKLGNWSISSY